MIIAGGYWLVPLDGAATAGGAIRGAGFGEVRGVARGCGVA